MNKWLLALLIFPLLMETLPVKPPCTITIIERGAQNLLLVVAVHGGCCHIFGIWNNRLLSNPLWKLIWRLLGWFPTREISLWTSVFIDMDIFDTLVTSHIWPGIWPFYRATNISTTENFEVNLLQILFDRIINGSSVCLHKWRLVLRLFCASSRLPPLWIHNIPLFSRSLLYKNS